MKVFISWSGDRSRLVAAALADWIPLVLQYVKPWMSDEDIAVGQRWNHEIAVELDECNIGILCTTPENQQSPWLLFEAGALAKSFEASRVIPALFDMDVRNISSPLSQFQSAKLDQAGTLRILQSIQLASENPLGPNSLQTLFDTMWPALEMQLAAIPGDAPGEPAPRSVEAILDDLVEVNNVVASRVADLAKIQVPANRDPDGREWSRRRRAQGIEDIVAKSGVSSDDPVLLLSFALVVRDELPPLAALAGVVADDIYGEKRSRGAGARIRQLRELAMQLPQGLRFIDRDVEQACIGIHDFASRQMHRREPTGRGA